ncbi:hypothetical protein D3C80_2161480 [compost metagenome]
MWAIEQGRHGGQQGEQQAALCQCLAPLAEIPDHHLGLAVVIGTPGAGILTHLVDLSGGQLDRSEVKAVKAVA